MAAALPAISGAWDDELVLPVPPAGRWDETGDGQHRCWVEPVDRERVRYAWDGVPGEPFQLIPQHDGRQFVWSPGMLHVAYYGIRDGRYFVGVDGAERPAWEGITRSVPPTFSADASRLAYGVFVDGEARLVVDGDLFGDWHPAPIAPVFSPDSRRLAFAAENRNVAKHERSRDYHQWMVVDGVAQPEHGLISADPAGIQFSPDSRRLMYATILDGRLRLVVDGQGWPVHDGIEIPTFSPDGHRLVYGAKGPRGVVLAGEEVGGGGSGYQHIGRPVFGSDGRRLAFFGVRAKDRMVAVVDGVEGPEFTDAWGNAVFSADGRRVAYLAQRRATGFLGTGRKPWVAVVDGREDGDWDEVSSIPHFSPDGAHVAFTARRGRDWAVVVDGVAGRAFDEVGPPRFDADGRLAFFARSRTGANPGYRVVVDGTDGPVMDDVFLVDGEQPFVFDPGGRHAVSVGWLDGAWRPIVDAAIGPGYLDVGRVRFEGGRAVFPAAGDDGFHHLSIALD